VSAGIVAFCVDGIGLAVVSAFVAAVTSVVFRSRRRRNAELAYQKALPRALDDVARSLRSGSGLLTALRDASQDKRNDVERDIAEVVRDVDLGQSLERSLVQWSVDRPTRSVRLTVACLSLAYETGASTVSGIEAVSSTVRNALSAEASAAVQATQARASATTLAVLPFVVSGPMIAFNDSARQFMLHSPIGLSLLLLGLALDVVGAYLMHVLVERSQS
jgi:tight adherence protein B